VAWREPNLDWSRFDVAVIRSTWDYIDEPAEFLSVMTAIDASPCRLFNPLAALRWNCEKSYLLELQTWGVPTVPTYRASAMPRAGWQDLARDERWRGAVLKPMIGAAGQAVHRVAVGEIAATLDRLAVEHPHQEFLVQPFAESVVSEGEWSFIYVAGALSHVLLKRPAPGDYRAHGIYQGTVELAEPSPEDVRQAEAILASLPFDLLYARLDLVRVGGRLSVMELELIEPMLYFNLAPHAAARLADACELRAGTRSA
jgi:glutathione synthase/RimK-type ligase-like ATP-grasp enzyme